MGHLVHRLRHVFDVQMNLPGSKSITLRDLSLAAIGDGVSTVRYPGICDDASRMVDSLRRLGIAVHTEQDDAWIVEGRGGQFNEGDVALDVGQSAASTRLLMGLCALRPHRTELDGHASMRARPNQYLLQALADLGATVESTNDGYLPASIVGSLSLCDSIRMKGDKSSQYFSALLQIGARMPNGLQIEVEGELVSKPYIDITIHELSKFGVAVENDNYQRLTVRPQVVRATDMTVEGDASAASYFAALATLHGGRIEIGNLGSRTQQGDFQFCNLMTQLGASVHIQADTTVIQGPPGGQMAALQEPIDMEPMPDVAPTLMALAPFIPGTTRITGLSTLRIKECDRIAAPVAEFKKFGIHAVEGPDWVEIPYWDGWQETVAQTLSSIQVETYHDHRIAMSFAVFGSKMGGVDIDNPRCVDKTYPNFWRDLERLYR